MREIINQEVGVVMYYDPKRRLALPHLIRWHNQDYQIGKLGYYHIVNVGKTRHHIFEVVDRQETIWFRLNFNSDNLHWRLEAISDGEAF